MSYCSINRVIAGIVLSVLLAFSSLLGYATLAHADELDDLESQVEATAAAYQEALERVDDLEARIEENQQKVAELEVEIETTKENANAALQSIYIYQNSGYSLLNMVLSSQNITDMLETIEYLNVIQEKNMNALQEHQLAKSELEATNAQLEQDMEEATIAKQEAEEALAQAQAARDEAMQRAIAQAESEVAASNQSYSSSNSSSSLIGTVSSGDVDWSMSYDEFIETWTERIDAYLAGSPLAGQGRTFAEAAWVNGVDPRWSPAIAHVESTKGAYCFRSYNAWGWGTSSWSSWEEAIYAHVNGLARLYGSTLTLEAAQKYCPSNAQEWYNKVLTQMNMI